jgi:cellulose synthase/poly-beta-1,6-N-acetylglucosamine synthase-like glycosyltransferase
MITPADKATTPGTAAPGSGRVGVPAARGGLEPGVTIVVIGRDEEAHLPGCFDAIAALDYPHERLEILYVDSGSRDASVRIAAEAGARVIEAGSRVRSAVMGS